MTNQIQTPADARRAEHRETVERLEAYVGANWRSHYRAAFEDLLEAERTGDAGLTWNWPATLIPLWFLYRRLPLAFFGFLGAHLLIVAGAVASGAYFFFVYPGLLLVLVLYRGYLADRLLFGKALRAVRQSGDRALLARKGAPTLWAPLAYVAAGYLVSAVAVRTPVGLEAMEYVGNRFVAAVLADTGREDEPGPAFRFAAEVEPKTETGEMVVTTPDGLGRITVPGTWTRMEIPNEFAAIRVGNAVLEQFAIVVSDARADLDASVDLERYARLRLRALPETTQNHTLSDPRSLTVDGKRALQYHLKARLNTAEYVRITAWVTAIEGADRYYLVAVWTRGSLGQLADPVQKSILESFRELPAEAAAAE